LRQVAIADGLLAPVNPAPGAGIASEATT